MAHAQRVPGKMGGWRLWPGGCNVPRCGGLAQEEDLAACGGGGCGGGEWCVCAFCEIVAPPSTSVLAMLQECTARDCQGERATRQHAGLRACVRACFPYGMTLR